MSEIVEGDMKLGLSRPLRDAVQQKFAQARQAGDLLFSNTELSVLHSRQKVSVSSPFCLRHSQPHDVVSTAILSRSSEETQRQRGQFRQAEAQTGSVRQPK